MLGDVCVGKTCIVNRYVSDSFSSTEATVVAGFSSKFLTVNPTDDPVPTKIKLQIWDTAGSEKFRSLSQIYYKKAAAVCLTYDVTSMASFEALAHWVKELEDNTHQDIIKYVVGNKCDLNEDEEVNVKVASNFAKNIGGSLFFVSAK